MPAKKAVARAKPRPKSKNIIINDDAGLERETDAMGARATQLRMWRVSIIKKKMEYVGRVQAADKASAELVAATEFQLKDHERTRLFIEEVPV
jgi:hypothetical protein